MSSKLRMPVFFALLLTALGLRPAASIEPASEPARPDVARIELVLAIDTSSSMDGLIESAKLKLWDIVSTLASAKPTPQLRVALLSYGNDGYTGDGWVRKDVGFTEDLDLVYEKLNGLTTNGGTEYVARVTHEAVTSLDWSKSDTTLKIVYVAGNEEATQDPKFNAVSVAKAAIAKGIIVNTIYCGNPEDTDAAGYRNVALAAEGEFAAIDQNDGTVVVSTPMDARLAELSGALNTTYIGYGRTAAESQARQAAQDTAAGQLSPSASASRAVAKGGKLYKNSTWDLVDASEEANFDIEKIPVEELPAEMQKMTVEERKAHIESQSAKRDEIQAEIQKLSAERQKYVVEEMKKQNLSDEKGLDKAIKDSLRKEAKTKNIEIE